MKDINVMLEEAKAVLDDLNIPYSETIIVVINRRAKGRWGCSKKLRRGYEIQVAERLLQDDITWESAMNTMIHELLHCYYNHRDHTGAWKSCAKRISAEYPQYGEIKRTASYEEVGIPKDEVLAEKLATNKYEIACVACGQKFYYKKRGRVVKLIEAGHNCCTCPKCGYNKFTIQTL